MVNTEHRRLHFPKISIAYLKFLTMQNKMSKVFQKIVSLIFEFKDNEQFCVNLYGIFEIYLKKCIDNNELEKAKQLLRYTNNLKTKPNNIFFNNLINYAKSSDIQFCEYLF